MLIWRGQYSYGRSRKKQKKNEKGKRQRKRTEPKRHLVCKDLTLTESVWENWGGKANVGKRNVVNVRKLRVGNNEATTKGGSIVRQFREDDRERISAVEGRTGEIRIKGA